ncbi:MAG: hypothetical protein MI740_16605 [Halanaerobiales bacterium]|nr:hypothetical protein [Halanaerobiales bacterium]
MTFDNVDEIMARLTAVFVGKFEDYQIKEYCDFLMPLDFELMHKTINYMVHQGTKFIPAIGETLTVYKTIEATENENRMFEQKEDFCYTCENKGAIAVFSQAGDTKLWKAYYCTECDRGRNAAYDGRRVSKYKSKYYMEPISKVMDPKQLAQINLLKKREVIPMPQYVRDLLQKTCNNMAV